jgi:hypothetical protein
MPECPGSDSSFYIHVQVTATCYPFLKGREVALPALNAGFFAQPALQVQQLSTRLERNSETNSPIPSPQPWKYPSYGSLIG